MSKEDLFIGPRKRGQLLKARSKVKLFPCDIEVRAVTLRLAFDSRAGEPGVQRIQGLEDNVKGGLQ